MLTIVECRFEVEGELRLHRQFFETEFWGEKARHRMIRVWRNFLSCFALAMTFSWIGAAFAAPSSIAILLSDESAPYQEAMNAIRATLDETRALVSVYPQGGKKQDFSRDRPDLIITVGLRATQDVAAQNLGTPTLAMLIPRQAFEKIAQQRDYRQFSALYLDQPLARQIDLIRLTLPNHARIGAVLGPESQNALKILQSAANDAKYGLVVEKISSEGELLPALQRVLTDSDVLLAMPDQLVFNKGTVQNLLLTAYRYQDPMIGFSQAYVKAGALAAVFTTPEQAGKHAGEVVMRALGGKVLLLPPPEYSKYFSVRVNYQVARSLGISVGDEADILQRLQKK